MRALFLDFDGVLHPLGLQVTPGVLRNGKPVARAVPVDLFCWVGLLAELLQAHPDVALVVHSNWRLTRSEEELARCLAPLQARVKGATSATLSKHASVQEWLERHPEVEGYLILDDMPGEFLQSGCPQFVPCHSRLGVSEPRVQAAVRTWLEASAP